MPPSNSYYYYSRASAKTKFLNYLRKIFTNPFLDKILSNIMHDIPALRFLVKKIIPPEYLYKKPSLRYYGKRKLKMNFDISNLVDHYIYFAFEDKAIINFIKKLKNDDVFIDIGANIGFVTLLGAKQCYNGKVISIEPSKNIYKSLLHHLSLNNINNVTALNIGLGETEKKERLYEVNEHNTGMNRISANINTDLPGEDILIKSLDNLLSEQKIETVDAIKLDVEGYEYNVLKGARKTLKQHHPKLLIEIDDTNLKEQGATPQELIRLLLDLDYDIYIADSMEKLDVLKDFTKVHFDIVCLPKPKQNA